MIFISLNKVRKKLTKEAIAEATRVIKRGTSREDSNVNGNETWRHKIN